MAAVGAAYADGPARKRSAEAQTGTAPRGTGTIVERRAATRTPMPSCRASPAKPFVNTGCPTERPEPTRIEWGFRGLSAS